MRSTDLDLAVAPPIKVKLRLKPKAVKDPIKVTLKLKTKSIDARDKMIKTFNRLKDMDDVGDQQTKV